MIADEPLNRLSMRQVPEKSAPHAAAGASAITAMSCAGFISQLRTNLLSQVADNFGNAAHHYILA